MDIIKRLIIVYLVAFTAFQLTACSGRLYCGLEEVDTMAKTETKESGRK